MRSPGTLTDHLLAWALGALALVWAVFIAFGYRTGQREADELTDGHLATASALLLSAGAGGFSAPLQVTAPGGTLPLRAHDYQQSLSVVVWDAQGRVLARAGDAPQPAFAAQDEGFGTLDLGQPAARWRVFSRWSPDRTRKVMVLLSLRERDGLARDIAEQMVEPGLWLLPAIALALGLAVQRGLRPLYEVSRQVHALDVHEARPLPLPRHRELADTVEAVNRLVERYHAALSRERDLASEFAHELRTPLAALKLQILSLARADCNEARDVAIARLSAGVERAARLVEQLLVLARQEAAEARLEPVSLTDLAKRAVGDMAGAAQARAIDLGLEQADEATVQGQGDALMILLRNLVDNAVKYTPAGGTVDVSVLGPGAGGGARLVVEDSGPGIPPEERERVFHRFYRVPGSEAQGSGLGLAIIRAIAERHGAKLALDASERLGGLKVTVEFAPR